MVFRSLSVYLGFIKCNKVIQETITFRKYFYHQVVYILSTKNLLKYEYIKFSDQEKWYHEFYIVDGYSADQILIWNQTGQLKNVKSQMGNLIKRTFLFLIISKLVLTYLFIGIYNWQTNQQAVFYYINKCRHETR